MLLAVESVGFVEGDAVAAPGEIAEQPAVIGRRAVPVGGQRGSSRRRRSSCAHLHRAAARMRVDDRQKLVRAVGAGVPRRGSSRGRSRPARREAPGRRAAPRGGAPSRPRRARRGNPRRPEQSFRILPRRARRAGCRRPAPRRPGWSGCPAALRRRTAAARARSRDGARRPRARRAFGQPAAIAGAVAGAASSSASLRDSARRRCRAAGRPSAPAAGESSRARRCARSSPQLPIQTRPSRRSSLGRRMEQARIGGLVPDEDAVAPAPAAVDLGERLAEGEHAVVAVEVEGADRVRIAHGAMMGVVEKEREAAAAPPRPADGRDEPWLVPFVHDHDVGAVDARPRHRRHRRSGDGSSG